MSQILEGQDVDKLKRFEARQLKTKSVAVKAKGTREAQEELRQGRILASNIRAAQAGSGGTTTDVGAIEQQAEAKQVTDYNAFAALFESESRAQNLELAAKGKRWEGKAAKAASRRKALATVISDAGKASGTGG